MNREAVDKFFERGILALVVAMLVFAPLAMGAVDAWAFLVVQALAMGVMGLWALRLWFSPRPQLLWPPLCWVVLAFALYAVIRYLTAPIEYVARLEMIQVLVYALLFFAIVNNVYRQESAQFISFTLFLVATAISAYAIFQLATHSNRVWNEISPYGGRASGTYISPNNFACFLELLLPLAVAYVLAGRMNPVLRILLAYASLVMAAGLAVTFSRGGWAAAAAGLLAVLLAVACQRHHRWRVLVLLLVVLVAGAYFFNQFLYGTVGYIERMEKLAGSGSVNLPVRLELWRAADRMWLDHFWWGAGPAHYDYLFREYRPESVQLRPDRAHNDYLNLLADWGTAGGAIVLAGMAIFVAGLVRSWRFVQHAENELGSGLSNRFAFFCGASAGLLALSVHSVVDFNLHIPANALLGVTLLALLSSNLRFATERYWVNVRVPARLLVTVVLAGGLAYLSAQTWRRGHETCWLARAAHFPPKYSPQHTAALEKAFAAEPMNFETAYDIGEAYRDDSFLGGDEYESQAREAMKWLARVQALNPHDAYGFLRYGMCLDRLDRHEEAEKYFNRAEALDPNGYYTVALVGWHYVQTGDYAAALPWFVRSLDLEHNENDVAVAYRDIAWQRLAEQASGQRLLPAGY